MEPGTEVIAARTMNALYIWLDIGFLCLLLCALLCTRRYRTALAGLLGGVLYFIVDYGIFYRWLGTRVVEGAHPLWFLLWLSMSYGFTNFAWIWVWLDHDGHAPEWSVFIVAGWLCTALLSQNFGASFAVIRIVRGTADYHGVMALLLFIGYGWLCVRNIRLKDKSQKAPLLRILAIGILVQFSWEFVLVVTGIRNPSLNTLVVNSLLETNMGLPYLYWIHRATSRPKAADPKPEVVSH